MRFRQPPAFARFAASRKARGAGDALPPCGDAVLAIQSGRNVVHRERTIRIAGEGIRARPHQFHRMLRGFRQHHRFGDVVVVERAAHAAAAARQTDFHLRGTQPGQSSHHVQRTARILQRRDDQRVVVGDLRDAIGRFQFGVRDGRDAITRLHGAVRELARVVVVAVVAHLRAGRLLEACIQRRGQRVVAVHRCAGSPFDPQQLASAQRGPGVLRQYRHAGGERTRTQQFGGGGLRNRQHLRDAFQRARGVRVQRLQGAAGIRATRDHRDQRVAGHLVDGMRFASGDDLARIDIAGVLTDQAEGVRRFQPGRRVGRRRQQRCGASRVRRNPARARPARSPCPAASAACAHPCRSVAPPRAPAIRASPRRPCAGRSTPQACRCSRALPGGRTSSAVRRCRLPRRAPAAPPPRAASRRPVPRR